MDQFFLERKLQKIEILPTFPEIIRKIISVLEDPLSSASDLKKFLDPSTASEILRIANTAYFGSRSFRRISSIEHAIAVIGFDHLSYIILQMPFLSLLEPGRSAFEKKEYLEHSMTVALFSKTLSEFLFLGEPKELYVAGMLHDIGILILYSRFQREWNEILSLIERGMRRIDAERRVLSFDHGFIGGTLLMLWNLPFSIAKAVMHHHTPEQAGDYKEYAEVLNIANGLAKNMKVAEKNIAFEEFFERYKGSLVPLCQERICNEIALLERLYLQLIKIKEHLSLVGEEDGKGPDC